MLDPCAVMAGRFEDMSVEDKHAALGAALREGERVVKDLEHALRVSSVGKPTQADEVTIETPMQSQMNDGSGAQIGGAHAAAVGRGSHMLPDSHMHRENVLRVRCIGEPSSVEESKEDVPMPSHLSGGSKAQPLEAPTAENGAPEIIRLRLSSQQLREIPQEMKGTKGWLSRIWRMQDGLTW